MELKSTRNSFSLALLPVSMFGRLARGVVVLPGASGAGEELRRGQC